MSTEKNKDFPVYGSEYIALAGWFSVIQVKI